MSWAASSVGVWGSRALGASIEAKPKEWAIIIRCPCLRMTEIPHPRTLILKDSKGRCPQFPLQKTAFSGPYLDPPFLKSCIRPQMRRASITLFKNKISTDTYDDWVNASISAQAGGQRKKSVKGKGVRLNDEWHPLHSFVFLSQSFLHKPQDRRAKASRAPDLTMCKTDTKAQWDLFYVH